MLKTDLLALLSVLDTPVVFAAALGLALAAAVVAGWLAGYAIRLRSQLAESRRDAVDARDALDSAIVEAGLTRARLGEVEDALAQAEAKAAELEARLQPEIQIERGFGESRFEAANRVLRDALRDRPQ